eukprot:9480136-Heterocapsa_arctica.AAC.1
MHCHVDDPLVAVRDNLMGWRRALHVIVAGWAALGLAPRRHRAGDRRVQQVVRSAIRRGEGLARQVRHDHRVHVGLTKNVKGMIGGGPAHSRRKGGLGGQRRAASARSRQLWAAMATETHVSSMSATA